MTGQLQRRLQRAGICLHMLAAATLLVLVAAGVRLPWPGQVLAAAAIVGQAVLLYAGPARRRPVDPPPPDVVTVHHWPAG